MSRILLIEDEVAIRRVLKKILLEEDASHSIYEAEDGKMAIETFGEGIGTSYSVISKCPTKTALRCLSI